MDCNVSRQLIEADLDGELDLVRHLELAAHVRACPACAQYAEQARARHAALRQSLTRFSAPPQLAAQIRSALQAEGGANLSRTSAADAQKSAGARVPGQSSSADLAPSPEFGRPAPEVRSQPSVTSRPPSVVRGPWSMGHLWNLTGLAASLAFAVLVGFTWGDTRARKNLLLDEAINDHVRSMQAGHLVDVVSSDQHTVKPWFAGKLDFAPPVTDLAAAGFPLAGGRLEHFDGRTAAALVFHRRAHAINLFIWPASGSLGASRPADRNGYHAETWTENGLNFLAVSEIPAVELQQFATAFRAAQR